MGVLTTDDINTLEAGMNSAILPVDCLAEVKRDIVRFSETEILNDYQKWIAREGYVLDIPELPFEARSIVLVTTKHKLIDMLFHYKDKVIRDFHILSSRPLSRQIAKLFEESGYHTENLYWLPQKRLAVCAGLCDYGRNNITYTAEWGSWFEILTFLSDMPSPDGYTWRAVTRMEACDTCTACLKACPTEAIKRDTYLIDNVRCLTLHIESGQPFPDWIPKPAVRSAIGCCYCQDCCPKNAGKAARSGVIDFSEAETELLLEGAAQSDMPDGLRHKIDLLALDWRLPSLPKNLRLLIENT
jgi:epoxyqueuosine reductase